MQGHLAARQLDIPASPVKDIFIGQIQRSAHLHAERIAPNVRRLHVGAPHLHPHPQPVLAQQLHVRVVYPLVLANLPLQRAGSRKLGCGVEG